MGIFWFLFLYLFIVKLFTLSNRNRVLEAVLGALGIWLVLALRSPYCGVDLVRSGYSYYNVFELMQYGSFKENVLHGVYMEKGWLVYCYFISLFTDNFTVFLAITALLQMIPIAIVFYHYSRDITLSYIIYICLGLYVFSFSGLRQAIAISCTFYSFYVLQKNRKILFFLLVLLASFFHKSAIIFVVVYPFMNKSLTFKKSIVYLVGLLALMPFIRVIIEFIVPLVFPGRYLHYEDEGGAVTMFLVYIVFFLLLFLNKKETPQIYSIRWMVLFCVACQSLGLVSSGAMTRIGFYFSIFFPLALPLIPCAYEKKTAMVVKFMACVALIAFFYLTTKDGYLNVVPYYFFWEKPL